MLGPPEFETMRRRLSVMPDLPLHILGYDDVKGATAVFLLVVCSTFPVIVPFLVMNDVGPALRVSQAIGAVMLFLIGWSLGVHAGRPGWRTGLVMVAIGAGLSVLTSVLGG
jgi:VIT1/CCC1 family predicted Fe2+/Mn2+ transporter